MVTWCSDCLRSFSRIVGVLSGNCCLIKMGGSGVWTGRGVYPGGGRMRKQWAYQNGRWHWEQVNSNKMLKKVKMGAWELVCVGYNTIQVGAVWSKYRKATNKYGCGGRWGNEMTTIWGKGERCLIGNRGWMRNGQLGLKFGLS